MTKKEQPEIFVNGKQVDMTEVQKMKRIIEEMIQDAKRAREEKETVNND
jgi:hypothetical protein